MNRKGFSLIELLAAVSILSILMGIAIAAITKYQIKTRNSVYETHEKNLKSAAENYLLDNMGEIPQKENDDDEAVLKLDATTLIDNQYLETLNDPVSKKSNCNDGTYVIVKNNGDITNGTDDINSYYDANGDLINSNTKNLDLEYKICLKCSDYISSECE